MTIEMAPGKGEWQYMLNEFNKRQLMRKKNRPSARWHKFAVYESEEEATAALWALWHRDGGDNGKDGAPGKASG